MSRKMKKEDSLVKVSTEIYEKVRERVEKDSVEFPSIKNFVEKAVKKLLEVDNDIKELINHQHKSSMLSKEGHVQHRIPIGIG